MQQFYRILQLFKKKCNKIFYQFKNWFLYFLMIYTYIFYNINKNFKKIFTNSQILNFFFWQKNLIFRNLKIKKKLIFFYIFFFIFFFNFFFYFMPPAEKLRPVCEYFLRVLFFFFLNNEWFYTEEKRHKNRQAEKKWKKLHFFWKITEKWPKTG